MITHVKQKHIINQNPSSLSGQTRNPILCKRQTFLSLLQLSMHAFINNEPTHKVHDTHLENGMQSEFLINFITQLA